MLSPEQKLLLKSEEARALCSIGRNRWLQLINSGEIPSCRNGRNILVSRRALEAWVDSQMQGAG